MCGGRHHKPASDEDDAGIVASNAGASSSGETGVTFFAAGLQAPLPKPSEWLAASPAPSEPIPVYTGPTKSGAALTRRGKRSRVAAKRPDASAEAKSDAKPPVRHANARPDAKPAAATEAKPAKPKTAAKPSKPKSTSGETKPAG